jgi:hypothetical protein
MCFFARFFYTVRLVPCRKVMVTIAAVGVSPYPWADVKKVVLWATTMAIDDLAAAVRSAEPEVRAANESKQQVLHALTRSAQMPFTAQRFCEILLEPRRYYSSPAKLAYALEKLLRVSAVHPDLSPEEYGAFLENLRKEAVPPRKPPMMAIDVDLRPPPAMMMGEGGWGILHQNNPPQQQQQSQQQQQQNQNAAQSQQQGGGGGQQHMDISD